MEAQRDFLENGLPTENTVVEVVDCSCELSLQNILLECVGFGERKPAHTDLQDGYEDISTAVDEIEGKCINFKV